MTSYAAATGTKITASYHTFSNARSVQMATFAYTASMFYMR